MLGSTNQTLHAYNETNSSDSLRASNSEKSKISRKSHLHFDHKNECAIVNLLIVIGHSLICVVRTCLCRSAHLGHIPSPATIMSNSYFVPKKEVEAQYRPKGYVRSNPFPFIGKKLTIQYGT